MNLRRIFCPMTTGAWRQSIRIIIKTNLLVTVIAGIYALPRFFSCRGHSRLLLFFDVISPSAPFRDARSINKRDIHHKSRFIGAVLCLCRRRTKRDRLGFGRGEAVQAGSECNRWRKRIRGQARSHREKKQEWRKESPLVRGLSRLFTLSPQGRGDRAEGVGARLLAPGEVEFPGGFDVV